MLDIKGTKPYWNILFQKEGIWNRWWAVHPAPMVGGNQGTERVVPIMKQLNFNDD